MALYYMSGVEIGRKGSKQERKATRQEKKEERKKAREAGAKPKKVAKVAVAPARGAFLTLVSLNAFGLANQLDELNKSNSAKFRSFWVKFGGEPSKLLNAVNSGKRKKAFFNGQDDIMGSAGAVAGAIAAATPVIIAAKKVLDETGIAKKLGEKAGDLTKAINLGKKQLAKSPNFSKENMLMPENTDVAKVEEETEEKTQTEKKGNKLILPLGLAAALLFS